MTAITTEHPSREELEAHLARRRAGWVTDHVLGGCTVCADVLGPPLLARLLRIGASERSRVEAVRCGHAFWTLGLARILRRRAREDPDVQQTRHLSALAVEVAHQLEVAGYATPVAMYELALSCLVASEAERGLRNLPPAERWLIAAETYLSKGTGNPEGRLQHARSVGRLRLAQGDWRGAWAALSEARALARTSDEPGAEGEIVLDLAAAAGEGGEPAKAAGVLEESVEIFVRAGDALDSARLRAQVEWWLDADEPENARQAYEQLAARREEGEVDGRDQTTLSWLSSRIAAAAGDAEGAETGLRAVRDELAEAADWYSYLEVSLDLAEVRLQREAAEAAPVTWEDLGMVARASTARGLPFAAQGRLAVLLTDAKTGRASSEELRAMRRYLRRGRRNPYLPFEDPAS